jgi:hypothetical protein
MPLDLTDDEKAALIELLRGTIDRDRFPLSPGSGCCAAFSKSLGYAQPSRRRVRR